MSGIDLSFVSGKEKFNYRVCAVIISEGKLLAMHDERSPYISVLMPFSFNALDASQRAV